MPPMGHHHHHDHDHHHAPSSGKTLLIALSLTLGFAGVEALSGWMANSLALMGDAGHMLSDATALGLAAFAAWIGKRKASKRHSYGLLRAEVLAALINGLFMLAVVAGIVWSATERLNQPPEVSGSTVIAIAFIGMLINIVVAYVLSRGEENLNTRAAMLHVLGDLLGSVGALLAGLLVYFWELYWADPVLSLLICVLILISTLRLLREVLHVVMEGVPFHLDLEDVGHTMAAVPFVDSVHDLHIWTLSSGNVALSAHLVISDIRLWPQVLVETQSLLEKRYHIEHVTLQPEVTTFILHRVDEPGHEH